jgi:hypothetical protein
MATNVFHVVFTIFAIVGVIIGSSIAAEMIMLLAKLEKEMKNGD